jgi:hypothetical protein
MKGVATPALEEPNSLHGTSGTRSIPGVFGENTAAGGVGVYGTDSAGGNSAGVFGEGGDQGRGVVGHSINAIGVLGACDNKQDGWAGSFDGDVQIQQDLYVGGNTFHTGNCEIKGNLFMSSPTSDIKLADIAENFHARNGKIIEPGSVVVLDQDGLIREGEEAYDRKVAGVVCGAGNYRPAIVLDKQSLEDGGLPVALIGKVCCRVDAQYSPIQVGDLLTTSPTTGHAMKATDATRALGAVIGKALSALQQGQGLIPVLVLLR